MIIRSQSRRSLYNLDQSTGLAIKGRHISLVLGEKEYVLGKYASDERVESVFDEICNEISWDSKYYEMPIDLE